MVKGEHIILMADVVNSRDRDQVALMRTFKKIVQDINKKEEKNIRSPLTITLGDEFQGVIEDLPTAISIVLAMEEMIIAKEDDFKLRYMVVEGKIETAINRQIAYEMLGSGLTTAREELGLLKKTRNRFGFKLKDKSKQESLKNAFFILQYFIDEWNAEKDYDVVTRFLKNEDYKQIAADLNKDPSLLWKRKKSLNLAEYLATTKLIKTLAVA